jgi:hypothetical protein
MAQVLMPQQRESDLDQILKGLQIAGSVYGLYTNSKDLELKKAQMDALAAEKADAKADKARVAAGDWVGKDVDDALASGGKVFETETPNAIKKAVILPTGEKKDLWWMTPAQVKADADAAAAIAQTTKDATKRSQELTDEARKDLNKAMIDFDPSENNQTRKIVDAHRNASEAEWLLSQGDPNLDALAFRKVFSIMEKGVFKAEDGMEYGAPVGFMEKAQAEFNKYKGNERIPPTERANLLQFTKYMKQMNRQEMRSYGAKYAEKRAAYINGANVDTVLKNLQPESYLDEVENNSQQQAMTKNRLMQGNGSFNKGLPGETNAYASPGASPFDQVPLDAIEAELRRRGQK